jgi:hypothetical protein
MWQTKKKPLLLYFLSLEHLHCCYEIDLSICKCHKTFNSLVNIFSSWGPSIFLESGKDTLKDIVAASYCFGKWSTCSEGGLPPFSSSHTTTNGYPYHLKRFPDLDENHHCWSDLHIYGVTNIANDNTCNNDGCLGKDMIKRWVNIKRWLHSLCYWNVWVFFFLFLFKIHFLPLVHRPLLHVINGLL